MSTPETPENEEDFAALLAEYEQKSPTGRGPQVGDVVQAPIISIGEDSVFVELGAKSEGMLDIDQVTDRDGALTVKVGDVVEATVVEVGGKSGVVVLRRTLGRGPDAAEDLRQAFEHQMPVEGVITEVNKGGVEVQVAGVRCFCPISQLDSRYVEDSSVYIGERHQFRITKFEGGRRPNIVLSRKALLLEEAAKQAEKLRERLEVGLILRGTVTTIKPYGAFVDIGGLEGMLHISELGYGRVNHPNEVLKEGQTVEVQIIKIEQTADKRQPERIGLSLKHLETDPWDEATRQLTEGSRIQGTVTKLKPFGAFVEVLPGVEGLVHISELASERHINHPKEVVSPGDKVEVTVLEVDPTKKRISLSMKAHKDAEARAHVAAYKPEHSGSLGTFGDLLAKSMKKK
jgi:small subunit ribosomal protein S1